MEPFIIPLRPALIFAVVLARVGGLVTFAPFWSHQAAPPRVRVVLAFMLAFVVTPIVAPRLRTPPIELGGFFVVIFGELLIGFVLGFVGRLVFSGIEMAAQVLTFQMGFSFSATIDPATRTQTNALGTIAQMFALVILLAGDGHHWMLAATVRSFESVSPGTWRLTPSLASLFLRLSADALATGVALAAPAIVVLLAVEFALAIAGRAVPQLQIMVLGFPIKIITGLWIIGASLYFLPGAVRTSLAAIHKGLLRALGAM